MHLSDRSTVASTDQVFTPEWRDAPNEILEEYWPKLISFLTDLATNEVAQRDYSQTPGEQLSTRINPLFIWAFCRLPFDPFYPLVQAVVLGAPDVVIWKEVVLLVDRKLNPEEESRRDLPHMSSTAT